MNNPFLKLLIRVLAIVGTTMVLVLLVGYLFLKIFSPHLLKFSKDIEVVHIGTSIEGLPGASFVKVPNGCENIYLDDHSSRIYVTTLDGFIYLLDMGSGDTFSVVRSKRIDTMALGIDKGPDQNLYVAATPYEYDGWKRTGGSIYRVDMGLDSAVKITGEYPCINGVAFDNQGNLYFASSNMHILRPKGVLYRMEKTDSTHLAAPQPFLKVKGLMNGLYCNHEWDQLVFSTTVGGVYAFIPGSNLYDDIYLKTKFMEITDDLCTDVSGNLWMTDPGNGTIKMFNPGTSRLTRFYIDGIGQTSSCRIRTEDNREMIYITELKQLQVPTSKIFDGRGVLIVPAQSLLALLKEP
jgi:hypothetical protein